MSSPEKERIKRHFARSLTTYEAEARVQEASARQLCDLVTLATGRREFGRILEIGCGSGVLSREITARFDFGELDLNDLAPESEACAPKGRRIHFLPGDIEQIELPDELDLVMSNAVFQWLAEPDALLARLAEKMNPGALIAFSSFDPENCREVKSLTGAGLAYPDGAAWRAMAERRFSLLGGHEELVQLLFDSPEAVLRHLRATGVGAPGAGRAWTRGALAAFSEAYRAHYSEGGQVVLTYHPVLIIAEKK